MVYRNRCNSIYEIVVTVVLLCGCLFLSEGIDSNLFSSVGMIAKTCLKKSIQAHMSPEGRETELS